MAPTPQSTRAEAVVLDTRYFLARIGEPDERPRDREFWSALALWRWKRDWREAKLRGDYARMDSLDRSYEMIVGI